MDYTSAGRQFDYITPLLAAGLSMKQTAMGLLLVTTTRANLLVWHRYTLMWEKDQQKPKVIEAMRFTCLSSTRLSHFYSGWDFCHNAPHTSHVMYTWTDFLKMLWSLFDRAPMYWLTSHRITCWMWRMKRPSWRIQSQSRKLEVRKVKLASSLLAIHPCTPRLGVGLRMSQLCTISTEHDAMTESMMSWSSLTLNYGQDSFQRSMITGPNSGRLTGKSLMSTVPTSQTTPQSWILWSNLYMSQSTFSQCQDMLGWWSSIPSCTPEARGHIRYQVPLQQRGCGNGQEYRLNVVLEAHGVVQPT